LILTLIDFRFELDSYNLVFSQFLVSTGSWIRLKASEIVLDPFKGGKRNERKACLWERKGKKQRKRGDVDGEVNNLYLNEAWKRGVNNVLVRFVSQWEAVVYGRVMKYFPSRVDHHKFGKGRMKRTDEKDEEGSLGDSRPVDQFLCRNICSSGDARTQADTWPTRMRRIYPTAITLGLV
jgi:hypothetical protein